jgi:predicted nucleotidyltransferase
LVYLFGSKALGVDSRISDVDIGVLLDKKKNVNKDDLILDLIYEFSQIFHPYKVDIVILNDASYSLQYNVISEGKILHMVNEDIKSDYETKLIKLFLDFRKFEREYYDYMHQTIMQERKDD